LASLALYLGRSWLVGFGSLLLTLVVLSSVTFQTGLTSLDKALPFLLSVAVLVPGAAAFFVFSERLTLRFRRLEPLYCSLYDERFWAHERFWKSNYNGFVRLFNGTPFKPLILRAQGMRIGSMLFDDGASTSEPTLIQIGDDCMLNNRSWIMCHSLEDGTFKSDRVKVGHDCTIGVGAFVHYGTVMGAGSSLEADTFFMKGTVAQRSTRWQGNPATEIHRTAS
jgi:non-ribosomal peptide synthetase-like protein